MQFGGKLRAASDRLYTLMITAVLVKFEGNVELSAEDLEVTPQALKYQLHRLKIDPEEVARKFNGNSDVLTILGSVDLKSIAIATKKPASAARPPADAEKKHG